MIKEMEIKMYKFDNTLFGKAVKKKDSHALIVRMQRYATPVKGNLENF